MKKYFLILVLVPGILIPIILINWLIDPYRIFHKPWIRDNYYLNTSYMRIESGGIINTEDFNSIILGSSMAANFSPSEATNIFNDKFVNISLDGSSIAERSVVLNYALKKVKVHNIIYSLDGFETNTVVGTPIAPYIYLYDSNSFNDFNIYASKPDILQFVFCGNILFSNNKPCPNTKSIENLTEWHSSIDHSIRFGGLHTWLEVKNNGQIREALADISKSIQTINLNKVKPINLIEVNHNSSKRHHVLINYLLNYAVSHAEVNFYLFFPPYARLRYAIMKQSNPQEFEIYLETLRFVVQESSKYNNIKIFGFENEQFLDDIANYKDTSHYHQRYNSQMLQWMKNGDHLLTPSNIEAYIKDISIRAGKYPLKEIGAQINDYLKRQGIN